MGSTTPPPGSMSERRGFIRHPVSIPIEIELRARRRLRNRRSDDVGKGGLRFRADQALERGTPVRVRISVVRPAFEAAGRVAWCERAVDGWEVGVCFDAPDDRFTVRMIEQVCHIEQFRREQEAEGRQLTPGEAAREWVRRFASDFPEV